MNSDEYPSCTVRILDSLTDTQLQELALVLLDCVEGGASVNFMHPFSIQEALAFWHQVAPDVQRGERRLLVAEDAAGIVGTVQLVLNTPPNQPHRAEISKLLVHRRSRRQGVGAALMRAAEEAARSSGKSLLVLDTASDAAERLYRRLGWIFAGTIPNYALFPHGGFCDTRLYYRTLN